MSWSFEVPAVPPSGNVWSRSHWAVQRQIKCDWQLLVLSAVRNLGIGQVNSASVTITIYFKENRRRDPDNFTATAYKLVLDALVRAGVLPDDSVDHVNIHQVRFAVDRNNPRTVVIVTPA